MEKLNLLLWNCRGYKNKKNEIKKRIKEFDMSVLIETKQEIENSIQCSG